MRWKILIVTLAFAGLAGCSAMAGNHDMTMSRNGMTGSAIPDDAPPGGDYRKVSELTALPEFIPGLGTLYVQPATLPAGPFLSYDRSGEFVATIYMIPLDAINAQEKFSGLEAPGGDVVSTTLYYNAGHPGVAEPHYHVVLWHVDPATAELK